jgi:hypothetical protein
MGKKAKFKKIRRFASQMPVIEVASVIGERLTGKDAMMDGVSEIEGKPVDQNTTYIKKKVVKQPLNHNRKMKAMYNKFGPGGVNAYVNAVNQYVNSKKLKTEEEIG